MQHHPEFNSTAKAYNNRGQWTTWQQERNMTLFGKISTGRQKNGTDRVFSSKNLIFFITVTLNQSAKTMTDSPLSTSRFSLVTSSGKYSSSGSTRSKTPKVRIAQINVLYCIRDNFYSAVTYTKPKSKTLWHCLKRTPYFYTRQHTMHGKGAAVHNKTHNKQVICLIIR